MHTFAHVVSRAVCGARSARRASRLAALALSLFLGLSAAQAAVITVNNNGNGSGSGTASNCDPGNANTCTLRDAIARAVGGDTIVFNLVAPNTTIVLSSELVFSYTANTNPISVDGGGTITLDGNNATRVINTNASTVTILRGLWIMNGRFSFGGGIRNNGTLTLSRCTLLNNRALTQGGAIDNGLGAILSIVQSTLSGNRADSYRVGGAIANAGTLTVTQSTLANNQAIRGNGGAVYAGFSSATTITESTLESNYGASGGGIFNDGGTLNVRHVSFAGNQADRAGGIYNWSGSAIVQRSIFWGNQSADLLPTGSSYGGAMRQQGGTISAQFNLFWQNVGGSNAQETDCYQCSSNANAISGDPLLGFNGVLYVPGAGSAAIDAVPCDPQETIDQRGLTRPQGAQCDAGSVEVQQCSLNLVGDASVRGTADATLALRLMLGVAGPAAVNGVDPTSTWTNVEPWWNACQPGPTRLGCTFDLDGNGTVDPAVDGLLLARIAMGFKDSAALQGITIPNGAPRSDWASISGYLQNTCWMALP